MCRDKLLKTLSNLALNTACLTFLPSDQFRCNSVLLLHQKRIEKILINLQKVLKPSLFFEKEGQKVKGKVSQLTATLFSNKG